MKLDANGPNAEQIRYWNEDAGPKWVELADRLDAQIGDLGRLAQERAAPRPGERVLDVGCGCGQTALELALRVGPSGHVTGIDLSTGMLEVAARRAREAGAKNVSFRAADAQTEELEPVDLIFSRFGVMFFADPVAAFANLRRALAPGGRLTFVCWQELKRNPWMLQPLMAAAKHVALPDPPAPGEPGPFSLGDPERVRQVLSGAGFASVGVEGVEAQLAVGGAGSLDEAADFLTRIGPTGRLLADADADTRSAVFGAIRETLAAHETAEGIRMACAVWLITAGR